MLWLDAQLKLGLTSALTYALTSVARFGPLELRSESPNPDKGIPAPRPVDGAWALEQAGAVHRAFLEATRTSPAF